MMIKNEIKVKKEESEWVREIINHRMSYGMQVEAKDMKNMWEKQKIKKLWEYMTVEWRIIGYK